MTITRYLLGWLTVIAGTIALFAAASQEPVVMAVAGIVAAVAALLWGLIFSLADTPETIANATAYREDVWARRDTERWFMPPEDADFEDEPLPWRPVWGNELGAPE